MKSSKQWIFLGAVLLGGVVIVTIVAHYNPRIWSRPVQPPIESDNELPLQLSTDGATWDKQVSPNGPECEFQSVNHCDFWAVNSHPQPVEIDLQQTSCSRCVWLEVAGFPSATWAAHVRRWAAVGAGSLSAFNPAHRLEWVGPALAGAHWEGPYCPPGQVTWHELHPPDPKVNQPANVATLPAADPDVGPAAGLLRLKWKAEKTAPERVSAYFMVRKAGGAGRFFRLEGLYNPVAPVSVHPTVVEVKDLGPRQQQTAEFFCYSSTRSGFPLTVRPSEDNPCLAFTVQPMTAAERKKLEELAKLRVLFGHKVTVTVKERISDTVQLDLGPYQSKITLTTSADLDPIYAVVRGTVRGEVTVGLADAKEEERDRIAFRTFRASERTEVTVPLFSEQPDMELEVESKSPNYLEVSLKKGKEEGAATIGHWILSVRVPPNRAAGRFPSGSAVVLKTKGNPPRRIRIPVTGNASR